MRRADDPTKGRQVDCWKLPLDGASRPLAYEFKLRVSIAASGQGRFAEEISFAEDANSSGATPVLVVLDPTMNPRLAELQAAFEARGGRAYLGDAAWRHLEEEAGETMARFIEIYVRPPIEAIAAFEQPMPGQEGRRLELLPLHAECAADRLTLRLGPFERRITRSEDAGLAGLADEAAAAE